MRKYLVVIPVLALAPADSPGNSAFGHSRRVCDVSTSPNVASCDALIKTDAAGKPTAVSPMASAFGATDLRNAYPNVNGNRADRNHVVAVVDVYGYSSAYNDLVAYRKQYFGSSAPISNCSVTSGKFTFSGTAPCFAKVNQNGSTNGLPAQNSGWAQELALDIQMASAMCPECSILLVQAKTANFTDIAAAVTTAGNFAGTVAISNSYGTSVGVDISSSYGYNLPYERAVAKKQAVTVSTGDNGYGISFPASVTGVVSTGGTSLYRTSGGWTQRAWAGTNPLCNAVAGWDGPTGLGTPPTK